MNDSHQKTLFSNSIFFYENWVSILLARIVSSSLGLVLNATLLNCFPKQLVETIKRKSAHKWFVRISEFNLYFNLVPDGDISLNNSCNIVWLLSVIKILNLVPTTFPFFSYGFYVWQKLKQKYAKTLLRASTVWRNFWNKSNFRFSGFENQVLHKKSIAFWIFPTLFFYKSLIMWKWSI